MSARTQSPLQLAYDAAKAKREDLESARNRDRREALLEFTAALDARLAREYGEQIRAAREEEEAAHAALMQERETEALTRQYPYPLGTVMVEWVYPAYSHGRGGPASRRLTGRRGVLEVITTTSEHPTNQGSWSIAKPGDLVIRILKKDGTPSKRYQNNHWRMRNDWVPEGTDLMQEDLSWPEAPPPSEADDLANEPAGGWQGATGASGDEYMEEDV